MSQPPHSDSTLFSTANLPTPTRCVADFCLIPVRTVSFLLLMHILFSTSMPWKKTKEKLNEKEGKLIFGATRGILAYESMSRSEPRRHQYRLKSRMFSA